MPLEIMLDIETLALTPDAAIWEVAACPFEFPDQMIDLFTDPAYVIASDKYAIDVDTVRWLKSDDGPAAHFLDWRDRGKPSSAVHQIHAALCRIGGFQNQNTIWWAKNSPFDFPILEHTFRVNGLAPPWHRSNKACMYTLRIEATRIINDRGGMFPHLEKSDKAHQAAEDVRVQIENVRRMRVAIDGVVK